MSRQPSWSWRIIHWQRPLKWDVVWGMVHRLVADLSLVTVIFETRVTRSRIQYRIGADPAHIEEVMRLVAELVPGVQLTTPTTSRSSSTWSSSTTLPSTQQTTNPPNPTDPPHHTQHHHSTSLPVPSS